MGVLQSAAQAIGQTVSDVSADVKDTVKAAATDTVKQIAKTPLDILEELLGSSPKADGKPGSTEEKGDSGQMAQAALQQKMQQDDTYRVQQHQELHSKIIQQSQSYYEQKKQMEEQTRQQQMQHEEQKKFEIKQLEKRRSSDMSVQAAKDASNAEKRVGAG